LGEAWLHDCSMIRGNAFSIRDGYIETKLAFGMAGRLTAIFAPSSTILLCAVKALKEHEMKIPCDVSIISFDDNPYMNHLDPPISRIAQPLEDIGIIAVKP